MDKRILKLTAICLVVVLVIQYMPYTSIQRYNASLGHEALKLIHRFDNISEDDSEAVSDGSVQQAVLTTYTSSIQQADSFRLVPYESISQVEIDMLNEYIESTLVYGNYTICTLIEYSRDEENNSNCYHFTWDDLRYTCIYITEGHNVPLLLYDVEITDDIVQHWDTI